jgi:magnesium transporter
MLSLTGALLVAKLIGGLLPLLAKLCRLDPAVMAQPIITTIVDASTLLIYFGLASVMVIPMLTGGGA